MKIIDDCFMVRCYMDKTVEYEYVHYVIHRIEHNSEDSKYKERMNLFLIGLDSVSSSSFQRALPKTLKYLQSFDNFYHFKKFHATGPGTTYNMVPLMSGYPYTRLYNLTDTFPGPFDE